MIKKLSRNVMRQNRHIRMRQTITGTAARPRLSVYRSNKGYYVQLVDDANQTTLVAVRSQDLGLSSNNKETANIIITTTPLQIGQLAAKTNSDRHHLEVGQINQIMKGSLV